MEVELCLMDDREVIKTVVVGDDGLAPAFSTLLNHILDNIDGYPVGSIEEVRSTQNIIRYDVNKALRGPATKESILEFVSPSCDQGIFSIVWKVTP